jgi:hypothetical protein
MKWLKSNGREIELHNETEATIAQRQKNGWKLIEAVVDDKPVVGDAPTHAQGNGQSDVTQALATDAPKPRGRPVGSKNKPDDDQKVDANA